MELDPSLIVSIVLPLGGALYTFFANRSKAAAAEMRKLENGQAAVERRVAAIEGELRHLPDKDAVTELKLALAELRGSVGRLDESVSGIGRTVYRIDDYLRDKGDHH